MTLKFGNRVTEKDVRDWLNLNEFNGNSAVITELELHAIRRPGWVQLYRFRLRVKSKPKQIKLSPDSGVKSQIWHDRVGIVLDDERIRNPTLRTKIWIYESEVEHAEQLESLSKRMLTCRTGQNGNLFWTVAFLLFLFLIAAVSASVFSS